MKIAILGGSGRLGLWYARRLRAAGLDVTITGRAEAKLTRAARSAGVTATLDNDAAIQQADVVMVSMPIQATAEMVRRAAKLAKPGALVCDLASVKTALVEAYRAVSRPDLELVSLHPLHGPRLASLHGVTILATVFRGGPTYEELRGMLLGEGARVVAVEAAMQDEAMAVLQGLTHFVGIAAARTLASLHVPAFETPAYVLLRTFLARIVLQDPALYASIQLENPRNGEMRRLFLRTVEHLCELCEQGREGELQKEIEAGARVFVDADAELLHTDACLTALARRSLRRGQERMATLGPPGTFSDVAVRQYEQICGQTLTPVYCRTIPEVFDAVKRGDVGLGVVPVENLIDGTIVVCLDRLFDTGLRAKAELLVPIHHALGTLAGTHLESIKRVLSIPPVLGQVRGWLLSNLPQAKLVEANSSAEAIMQVANNRIEGDAAIGLAATAEAAGLEVLARNIEDEKGNLTRFFVIAKTDAPRSGTDRTSLCVHEVPNRSGSLEHILAVIARHGVNLSKIESRPTRRRIGEYQFYIDVEGHREDEALQATMAELNQEYKVTVLGSYPRAF